MRKELRILIVMGLGGFLAACQREPMIRLSEENQARLEASMTASRLEASQAVDEGTESEASEALGSQEAGGSGQEGQAPESQDPAPEITNRSVSPEDIRAHWKEADRGTVYNFDRYMPYGMNQIKTLALGDQQVTTYMTFGYQDLAKMQVQKRYPDRVVTEVFKRHQGQLRKTLSTESINPYDNILESSLSEGMSQVLLEAPLERGHSWEQEDRQLATITNLYEEVTLNGRVYDEVVEVLVELGRDRIQLTYYAPDLGVIAQYEGPKAGGGDFVQLVDHSEAVMIVHPIQVAVPDLSEPSEGLEWVAVDFAWQTNGSLAAAFEEVLRELGYLDETIQVNQVYLNENNVAVMDFTPGVVAVLNRHQASEATVIQGIVRTLGDFFSTDQVRLTVNGNGLLANTVPYPEGGIYTLSRLPDDLLE